jgi:NAD-dependent DNA ligase
MEQTSIAVSKKSKKEWENFKNYPNESMESMINRILKAKTQEDEELLTAEDIKEIKESIADIEKGHFKTQAQMKKKYGL